MENSITWKNKPNTYLYVSRAFSFTWKTASHGKQTLHLPLCKWGLLSVLREKQHHMENKPYTYLYVSRAFSFTWKTASHGKRMLHPPLCKWSLLSVWHEKRCHGKLHTVGSVVRCMVMIVQKDQLDMFTPSAHHCVPYITENICVSLRKWRKRKK